MPEIDLNTDRPYSTAQFADLANEILAMGRSLRFRARGVSMRPFIQDGDLLEIQPVKTNDIRVGDILLYYYARKQLLVHRVVRILRPPRGFPRAAAQETASPGAAENRSDQLQFLIQGDAALKPDGLIPPEFIMGRVAAIERAGRMRRIDRPISVFLAAMAVFALSVYKFIRRRTQKLSRK